MNRRSQIWLAVALIGTAIYSVCAIVIGFNSLLVKTLSLFLLVVWWMFFYSRWMYKKDENEFWDGRKNT